MSALLIWGLAIISCEKLDATSYWRLLQPPRAFKDDLT